MYRLFRQSQRIISIIKIILIYKFSSLLHRTCGIMNYSYSKIAQRHLSKNRKYYKDQVQKKDQQNILQGDIESIISKLSFQKTNNTTHSQQLPQLKRSSNLLYSIEKQKTKFLQNSPNFFQKDQYYIMKRKQLRKQINNYINKMKQPLKIKTSLYQEYVALAQETTDYLEYYLTNFGGKDQGTATQILKEQGKTIILLILRKKYKCFEENPPDIVNRILLSFHLNPLNDFQFVLWQKFMRIRKLINGDFNRQECNKFILQYFFTGSQESISGVHFWAIFTSVIRKIKAILNTQCLNSLINRILQHGYSIIGQDQTLKKEDLRRIMHEDPLFIWKQFVILTFI